MTPDELVQVYLPRADEAELVVHFKNILKTHGVTALSQVLGELGASTQICIKVLEEAMRNGE